jgi:Flp pilus assembly protein TadD
VEPLIEEAKTIADPEDADAQTRMRPLEAKLRALRGEYDAALRLAAEAAALADGTDYLDDRGRVHEDFGLILLTTGDREQAAVELTTALSCFERKENVVAAARVRTELAELNERGVTLS